ncbi:MAG TPA: hypothetical protein VN175_02845 [Rhizomicrobium sp.]|nr:hypothetical protein [Rhizomicrobium sp.]
MPHDPEVRELLLRAKEAEEWAATAGEPLKLQWIEIANGYRLLAKERLEVLFSTGPSDQFSA